MIGCAAGSVPALAPDRRGWAGACRGLCRLGLGPGDDVVVHLVGEAGAGGGFDQEGVEGLAEGGELGGVLVEPEAEAGGMFCGSAVGEGPAGGGGSVDGDRGAAGLEELDEMEGGGEAGVGFAVDGGPELVEEGAGCEVEEEGDGLAAGGAVDGVEEGGDGFDVVADVGGEDDVGAGRFGDGPALVEDADVADAVADEVPLEQLAHGLAGLDADHAADAAGDGEGEAARACAEVEPGFGGAGAAEEGVEDGVAGAVGVGAEAVGEGGVVVAAGGGFAEALGLFAVGADGVVPLFGELVGAPGVGSGIGFGGGSACHGLADRGGTVRAGRFPPGGRRAGWSGRLAV